MKNKLLVLAFCGLVALANAKPQEPLFSWPAGSNAMQGPETTFTVDIDLSKTKIKGDETKISLTISTPHGITYQLISRRIHMGEKVHWQGKIPATGKYTVRIISANGSSSGTSEMTWPVYVKLTITPKSKRVLVF